MEYMGYNCVTAITVIAYLVGEAVKLTRLERKWIPAICGLVGAVLGIGAMYLMPDYPAADHITAVAVGIVSGLAATGANEVFRQLQEDEE